MNYGIPYLGSKSRLVERLVPLLPSSDTFVDLFAGGCAVTHAAVLSGKWRRVVANDVDPLPLRLFKDAMEGRAVENFRWFSRKEFFESRESDPYARFLFSFSNNGADYAYPPEIEPLKRELSRLVLSDDWHERRVLLRKAVRTILGLLKGGNLDNEVEKLGRCQALEHLERLERLERLKGLAKAPIVFSNKDYRDVELPEGSTVYCDIPYRTAKQAKGTYIYRFDYGSFYEWALSREFPVFVSEYTMPEGFSEVASFRHIALRGGSRKAVQERVFVQSRFAQSLRLSA